MSLTEVRTMPAIGPRCAGILMTPEEFDEITEYNELYDYELIHGVLVVSPIPSMMEAEPNDYLGYLLLLYREQHPQGAALDLTAPQRYIPTATSRRKADRVIWAGLGRRPNEKVDIPTIAVEFVSPGKVNWRRDYEDKRREYLEIGVVEYWVVDRFARTMTVYRNLPRPLSETVIGEGGTYQTELLPGFEVPVGRLLEAADGGRRPG